MSNPTPTLSPEVLWNHIDYHEDTGYLSIKPDAPHPKIQQRATDCICVEGRNYSYTRLSFYMHHAYMPKKIVKANGNVFDFRIENLQEYVPVAQPKPRNTRTPQERIAAVPKLSALERNRIEAVRLKAEATVARKQAKRREIYERVKQGLSNNNKTW